LSEPKHAEICHDENEEIANASQITATNKLVSWLTFDTEKGYPFQNFKKQNFSFEIIVL